jgi:putative restriction endonuclease
MVDTLRRDARFREVILKAYGYRCAVSGFELGRISKTKPQGLIDAAHIRPVWQNGPDDPSNGIPLTPTLHRFFDAGLFTLEYRDGELTVLTSAGIETEMLVARDGDFRLPLRDGLRLLVPGDRAMWPSPEQLRFHRREVFQSA